MTAALEGGEWSAARPGRTLHPGKTRYQLCRRLGGPQGRSGRAENLVPTGIRSQTVQPVVSRYTDWATGPVWRRYILEWKDRGGGGWEQVNIIIRMEGKRNIQFYLINLKVMWHNGYLITDRTVLEWILQTGCEGVKGIHVARDKFYRRVGG